VSRAVFVGDHPVADVAGARGAGMRAIWKRDPAWPPPVEADAIVDDLGDLLSMIRRLAAAEPS
jgi:putative hydrolase of the HAD superfamily